MKKEGSWFKQYQGGHYAGNQKCGQETFKTGNFEPVTKPKKDKGKVSKKGKSSSY